MSGISEARRRNYKAVNRKAWMLLAQQGIDSSQPFAKQTASGAKRSLDPDGWIDWKEIRQVLCLAAAGGQQAPLFGSLGCRIVSCDLCPDQLKRDATTALQYGFEIECLEADMLDLSALYGRDFDLVYQAVSACYIPNVRRLYSEVSRVLRPGGYYRVEHWNPVSMQLADDHCWTGHGYELVRPCISGRLYVWRTVDQNGQQTECWHYIHSLEDLIGGLCEAGLNILHFSERGEADENAAPGVPAHVYSFAKPFFLLYAQKANPRTSKLA